MMALEAVKFTSIPLAPSMTALSSIGEWIAFLAASMWRCGPEALPMPISASPDLLMMRRTSMKSTLMAPALVITSEMPWMAWRSTSSASR